MRDCLQEPYTVGTNNEFGFSFKNNTKDFLFILNKNQAFIIIIIQTRH